jgi:hypothetical protein
MAIRLRVSEGVGCFFASAIAVFKLRQRHPPPLFLGCFGLVNLRMGAHCLHHAKDYLGEFFRRITRRLGKPQAVTATAHKLARIIYHLLSTREAYNEGVFHKCEEETLRRAELRLRKQAAQLGFQVMPVANP